MSSAKFVKVIDKNTNEILLDSVRWCSSHLCRLRGLQFHRPLKPGEGLILVKSKDTIKASSIHMFFVFFPIAAIWINGEGIVTNAELAKPWRPYYASPLPARYILETTPDFLDKIVVGAKIEFR